MTGDGLTDLVRIRNSEICYWPNTGYGKFGAKVAMANAPVFDRPELFDPALVRLADVDGSGNADLLYLGRNQIFYWVNQAGNSWSVAQPITALTAPDKRRPRVTVADV